MSRMVPSCHKRCFFVTNGDLFVANAVFFHESRFVVTNRDIFGTNCDSLSRIMIFCAMVSKEHVIFTLVRTFFLSLWSRRAFLLTRCDFSCKQHCCSACLTAFLISSVSSPMYSLLVPCPRQEQQSRLKTTIKTVPGSASRS